MADFLNMLALYAELAWLELQLAAIHIRLLWAYDIAPQLQLRDPLALVEMASMLLALSGSLLWALKGPRAAWGWILFTLANIGWIAFAYGNRHPYMLLQYIGFTVTSVIGTWNYLVVPALDEMFDALDRIDGVPR